MQILRGYNKGSMVSLRVLCAIILVFVYATGAWSESKPPAVLKPVVAGYFYPSDRRVLEQKIDGYLKEADSKLQKSSAALFGLISPHAGYDYSGRVAAAAYRQIVGKGYRTVFILGSSHSVPFQGISIYPTGAWETPLGKIAVDEQAAAAVMERCNFARFHAPAFEREHSLEVQLPFLQRTLENFKVVHIVMGRLAAADYRILAEVLTGYVQKNSGRALIVASTDMSHFHPYQEASAMDQAALKQIEAMDLKSLRKSVERGTCELCGVQAVITIMKVAENMDARVKILDYANSGDVTGDKSRVVGYGSVGFYLPEQDSALSDKEQKTLLQIARRTLEGHVGGKGIPRTDTVSEKLMEKRGVFVTLQKNGMLRGCIGYIKPIQPLALAVAEMTVSASSRDPRFPPVTPAEIKDVQIEISALSPMKRVFDVSEIKVGQHGLYIVRAENSGLLLPQVATMYAWNGEEFLKQTCLKAGLPSNAWKDKETQVYVFSAQVFSE
jgi:AmmeMemoRadiSam system protein B/AmmeMemoRadiSam system protein A